MSSLNILVSGSGVAGNVFAYWILRAYPKATITIVERWPAPRLTGASVDIRSSAVDIIKRMGTEQEIRNQGTQEAGIQFVTAAGKPIATFEATGNAERQSVTSEYEIFRGALAKIFIDKVGDRVKIIFDEFVQRYEEHEGGIEVTFAKSKEVKTYDLLVAADGMSSKIRGMMLNTKPQEQIYDQGMHVAYFTIKNDLLQGSKMAKAYTAPGGRVVFLRPDPDPAGRTRGNLINLTLAKDTQSKERFKNALQEGTESYMKLMEELFADVGWLTPDVLKGMRESDDFYSSHFAQVRSPKIQKGRVVLLGDAGYATPGFGTSLAIIGGYVLAGELLNSSGDVRKALERYEKLLLPFAKGSQGGGNAMHILNPQSELGIKVRNWVIWFVTWARLHIAAMALAATLGFAEKKIDMPDYPWPTE